MQSIRAEVRETHSSTVLLLGDYAYKFKKPVDLGFLDFRTPAARERACRRELALNRRLAPDVYLDVVALTAPDGTVYEHGVAMRRMPADLRLATMVERGEPVERHLRALARLLADFHARAERGPLIAAEGDTPGLRRRWLDNLRAAAVYRGGVLPADTFDAIRHLALAYLDGRAALLAERAAAGRIVDGHGDLLAEDVFCLPDYPRVLDCIDFDDRLRWVDVLDDAAFLAMDLEHLGRPDLAAAFLRWYGEFAALPPVESLRHHYVAYRAFVRAKVACIRTDQGDPEAAGEARRYAELAATHLRAGEVRLVLVGGAPGTGKTTVAGALADRLGWVLVGTDTVRPELPAADSYSAAAKALTYRAMLDRARRALARGESVIADATWTSKASRDLAADVAATTASRLIALECRAPVAVAAARAEHRKTAGTSVSAAGADIARLLAAARDPWPQATGLDTSDGIDAALRTALAVLSAQGAGASAPAARSR